MATVPAYTVQHRLGVVYRKSVLLENMPLYILNVVAFKMYKPSAAGALQMKMADAVSVFVNILITGTFSLVGDVFSYPAFLHKLFQSAVNGGLAYFNAGFFKLLPYFVCRHVFFTV